MNIEMLAVILMFEALFIYASYNIKDAEDNAPEYFARGLGLFCLLLLWFFSAGLFYWLMNLGAIFYYGHMSRKYGLRNKSTYDNTGLIAVGVCILVAVVLIYYFFA